MPPATIEISVRLTSQAHENLLTICVNGGISVRAAFEGCCLCALEYLEKPRRKPAEREFGDGLLDTARWLVGDAGARPHRINLRLEPEINARVKKLAELNQLSVSSIMAAAFTSWGRDWGSPQALELRDEVWTRAVATAQRLDWERRMKRPVTLRCHPVT